MQPGPRPSATYPLWKGILTGFLCWLAAFTLYMLPAVVVGFSMGLDLGPRLNDNAEVSRRISQTIGAMYQSGWYLHLGFIIVLGGIIFWRASRRAKQLADNSVRHGLATGVTAAVLVTIQMMPYGVSIYLVVGAVACLVAGVAGGQRPKVTRKAE